MRVIDRVSLTAIFTGHLRAVDPQAVRSYGTMWPVLAHSVNQQLLPHVRTDGLLGDNTVRVMFDNHAHHARFIHAVLKLRTAPCLIETLIWVYRSYLARGFSAEYFPIELQAWMVAIRTHLAPHTPSAGLLTFYQALHDHHADWLAGAQAVAPLSTLAEPAASFLNALLSPDPASAQRAAPAMSAAEAAAALPGWWDRVITPALHMLGSLWAEGRIDVAQEHVGTAIASRVIERSLPRFPEPPSREARVGVFVSPDEQHEVGARLVADALSLLGYPVVFCGANTPVESVIGMLQQQQFDHLALSTTMVAHLPDVSALVGTIRQNLGTRSPNILVGGGAYAADPGLWQSVGADAYLPDLQALVTTFA